jgi:hypothetical protein
MKITTAIIIFIGFTIGFFTFLYMNNWIPAWLNGVQQLLTLIYTAWISIPQTLRELIMGLTTTISTVLASFFAWTKIRAMGKLQETKIQASQQITQLEGEKGELEAQVKQSTTKGIEGLIKERDAALQSRDEAQTLITQTQQQMRDMQNRHQGEIASLQARLDKYEPKERIVVK